MLLTNDLSYFIAGALILSGVALVIRRLGNTDGAADWLLAWVCLLGAGLDRLIIPPENVLSLITPMWDTLFAGLLASGSLRFTQNHRYLARWWLLVAVVSIFRVAIEPQLGLDAGTVLATLFIFIACGVSSWVIWQQGRAQDNSVNAVMSFMFLLPLLAQANYTYVNFTDGALGLSFFVWLVVGIVLIMTQMMLLVERTRQESALKGETLALMAQEAPVGLCLTNEVGDVQAMNRAAMKLLDLSGVEGQNLTNLLQTKLPQEASDAIFGDGDYELTSGANVRIHHHPIRVETRDLGDVWFFEDISLVERVRGIIPDTNYVRALRNVAGNIAHIFNNQLTVMMGNNELIRRAGHEDIQLFLDELSDATARCSQVVSDFLQIAGRPPGSNAQPTLVEPLVREALRKFEGDVLDVSLAVDDSLRIDVDPHGFRRAIEELVSNALDAGAKRLVVAARLDNENYADVRVEDDGCGIPVGDMERVFEPFFSTKPAHMGAGLGLSLVLGVANAHGGSVTISRGEVGTRVATRWPSS